MLSEKTDSISDIISTVRFAVEEDKKMNEREELLQILMEHPEVISQVLSVLLGPKDRKLPDP